MHGQLQSLIWTRDGRLVWENTVKNLIVDVAYGRVMNLLAGVSQADQYITHMQIGTGTIAPAAGNTALTMPVMSKAISNVERGDPGAYWVRFDMYLGSEEGNGFTYTEAGLLIAETGLGVVRLFAHALTGVADEKDSDHQFGFKWTLFT